MRTFILLTFRLICPKSVKVFKNPSTSFASTQVLGLYLDTFGDQVCPHPDLSSCTVSVIAKGGFQWLQGGHTVRVPYFHTFDLWPVGWTFILLGLKVCTFILLAFGQVKCEGQAAVGLCIEK